MAREKRERRTTGGCFCGAIRYEAVKLSVLTVMCHCECVGKGKEFQ